MHCRDKTMKKVETVRYVCWDFDLKTKELLIWNEKGNRTKPDIILNNDLQKRLLHLLKDVFEG